MLKLKELRIKNFLTFGNTWTTIPLNRKEFSLLLGDNKDNGTPGYSKNGVGKSNVLKAICYALFDDTADKVKMDNYINFINEKGMEVSLDFELNGVAYTINRGRKPSKLEMFRNGTKETQNSENANAEIIDLLGYDLDTFLNTICLVNSDDNRPFLALKPTEQKNFIENFLNLNLLTKRAEVIKGTLKDIVADISVEQTNLKNKKDNNERVQNDISRMKLKITEWEESTKESIRDLIMRLNEITNVDIPAQLKLHDEADELQAAIAILESTINEVNRDLSSANNMVVDITASLERYDNCVRSEEETGIKTKQSIAEAERVISEINRIEIEAILEQHEVIKEAQVAYNDLDKVYGGILRDIKEIEKDLTHLREEHDSLSGGVCPKCKQKYTDGSLLATTEEAVTNATETLTKKEAERAEIEVQATEYESIINEGKSLPDVGECRIKLNSLNNAKELLESPPINPMTAIRKKEEDSIRSKFMAPDEEFSVGGMKIYINKAEELVGSHMGSLSEVKTKKGTLEVGLNEVTSQIKRSRTQLAAGESQIGNYQTRIAELEEATNPFTKELEHIKTQTEEVNDEHLKELQKIEEHHRILIKLLTDSKSFVRKNMVDQYIPFINKKTNEYLQMLDSPNSIEINPDMTVDIYYNTHQIGYGSVSKGQKLRLNLAISLAFRDFNTMVGKGSNILMMDEYLDNGLCQDGFLAVVDLLKKTEIENVMVISHREEMIPMVDRVIDVVMEQGFTTIENA